MSTGESPRAGASQRMSKTEAELGKSLAVLEVRMDELRRDLARMEGATGEHTAQITAAASKASEALTLAKQALDEARRQRDTGVHGSLGSNGRRDATLGGVGAVGGAGLYALAEWIIRGLGG